VLHPEKKLGTNGLRTTFLVQLFVYVTVNVDNSRNCRKAIQNQDLWYTPCNRQIVIRWLSYSSSVVIGPSQCYNL